MNGLRYRPIEDTRDLPQVGAGYESAIFDIKRTYGGDKAQRAAAVDVATFANHLGGTLLIGADEGPDGSIASYQPLSEQHAEKVRTFFSRGVARLCSPRPIFADHSFPREGGVVIALNVPPHLLGIVGVRDGNDHVWSFPVRSGKDKIYLNPEQLPLYLDPRIRRNYVLLSGIGDKQVRVQASVLKGGVEDFRAQVCEIDVERNAVAFAETNGHRPTGRKRTYPLDLVRTVFFNESVSFWEVWIDR